MLDTDKGLAVMESDLGLLFLTVHQRVFLVPTRFHHSSIRILATFGKATEALGREWGIPSLEGLLLAPMQVRDNRTGRTLLANLLARDCQISTIQQRTVAQI